MQVPRRFDSLEDYRYGFQGQEKDDEVKGEGNSLNYTFRMHDPRVGRFFAVDPLTAKYPYYSPYQFSGNRPIDMIGLEGLEPTASEAAKMSEDVYDPRGIILDGGWEYDNENNIYLDQTNKNNGFSSIVYSRLIDGKKEYAYVTAGTDDTADLLEDIIQPMGYSNQVLHSINNAKALRLVLGKDANITWVGHSLGGLLASANALATGGYAITFNAAGLSDGVKEFYSLNRKAKIEAYVVEGEAVDKMQRVIALKAEGIIYKIPDFQSIPSKIAEESLPTPLKKSYQSIRSIQKHMIGTVIEFLEKMEKAKQRR